MGKKHKTKSKIIYFIKETLNVSSDLLSLLVNKLTKRLN